MTQHRNQPRDIIFDMEDDIGDLRRHANIVLCLSLDDALEDVHQDAFHQVARGLLACHRDLHEKFKRLFDQIVRADTDTPEPAEPAFNDLFAQWKKINNTGGDMTDEEATRLNRREEELIERIVVTPVVRQIAAKVHMAKAFIGDSGSSWSDERDKKVLDSIMADLAKLS